MTLRKRAFHHMRWNEPIIYQLSTPGSRGLLVPEAEEEIEQAVGDGLSSIPIGMRRSDSPICPNWPSPRW